MSNSLCPHGQQHTRLTCPSLPPSVGSNSYPLSQWCYLTISSSAIPFSLYLQSFTAPGPFPVSQLFTSGGQSISYSISPSNEYSVLVSIRVDWFDLFAVQGTIKSLLQHHNSKASMSLSLLYGPTLTSIHDYWKSHSFDSLNFCQQWCLCFLIC